MKPLWRTTAAVLLGLIFIATGSWAQGLRPQQPSPSAQSATSLGIVGQIGGTT
jgi:hypothetical protein